MVSDLSKLEKLAAIVGVAVKQSTLPELSGVLLCGSGFHLIWNPYKDSAQAFAVMFKAGVSVFMSDTEVVVTLPEKPNVTAVFEDFDKPWHALSFAICEAALK